MTTFAFVGFEIDPVFGFKGLRVGIFDLPFPSFLGLILTIISGMSSPESFDLSDDLLLWDLAVIEAATQDFLFVVSDISESWLLLRPFEEADSFPSVLIEFDLFE